MSPNYSKSKFNFYFKIFKKRVKYEKDSISYSPKSNFSLKYRYHIRYKEWC